MKHDIARPKPQTKPVVVPTVSYSLSILSLGAAPTQLGLMVELKTDITLAQNKLDRSPIIPSQLGKSD